MKMTINKVRLIRTLLFAAAGTIAIAGWVERNGIESVGLRPAAAAEGPRVIEIKAKDSSFRAHVDEGGAGNLAAIQRGSNAGIPREASQDRHR